MGRIQGKFIGATFTQETPSGTVNGTNVTFTLSNTPASALSVIVTLNGVVQVQGSDYSLAGVTITFATAPSLVQTVYAHYLKTN